MASKSRRADLAEFDPGQFDISFSDESDKSIDQGSVQTKEEHREDKKMIDQMNAIASLMKRIDTQLANKNKLLASAANTPNKPTMGMPQFSEKKPVDAQRSKLGELMNSLRSKPNENDSPTGRPNPSDAFKDDKPSPKPFTVEEEAYPLERKRPEDSKRRDRYDDDPRASNNDVYKSKPRETRETPAADERRKTPRDNDSRKEPESGRRTERDRTPDYKSSKGPEKDDKRDRDRLKQSDPNTARTKDKDDTGRDRSSKPRETDRTRDRSSKPRDSDRDRSSRPKDSDRDRSSRPRDSDRDRSTKPRDSDKDRSSRPRDSDKEREPRQDRDKPRDKSSKPKDSDRDRRPRDEEKPKDIKSSNIFKDDEAPEDKNKDKKKDDKSKPVDKDPKKDRDRRDRDDRSPNGGGPGTRDRKDPDNKDRDRDRPRDRDQDRSANKRDEKKRPRRDYDELYPDGQDEATKYRGDSPHPLSKQDDPYASRRTDNDSRKPDGSYTDRPTTENRDRYPVDRYKSDNYNDYKVQPYKSQDFSEEQSKDSRNDSRRDDESRDRSDYDSRREDSRYDSRRSDSRRGDSKRDDSRYDSRKDDSRYDDDSRDRSRDDSRRGDSRRDDSRDSRDRSRRDESYSEGDEGQVPASGRNESKEDVRIDRRNQDDKPRSKRDISKREVDENYRYEEDRSRKHSQGPDGDYREIRTENISRKKTEILHHQDPDGDYRDSRNERIYHKKKTEEIVERKSVKGRDQKPDDEDKRYHTNESFGQKPSESQGEVPNSDRKSTNGARTVENLSIPSKRPPRKQSIEPAEMTLSKIQKSTIKQNPETTVQVPLMTYPKIKNLRRKSAIIQKRFQEEKSIKDSGEPNAAISPETMEEYREEIRQMIKNAEDVIDDLENCNKNNTYVTRLKDELTDIKKANAEAEKTGDHDEVTKSLGEFVDQLKKLDVEEVQKLPDKEEARINQLVAFGEETAEAVQKPGNEATKEDLKAFVLSFLDKYSKKVKALKSPLASVLAREVQECIEKVEEIDNTKPPEVSEEFLKLVAHAIKENFMETPLNHASKERAKKQPDGEITPDQHYPAEATLPQPGSSHESALEFNDFVRSTNKIMEVPFGQLEGMVSNPENKKALEKLRTDNGTPGMTEEAERKSTLLQLNTKIEEKETIHKTIAALGKEVLPPRVYYTRQDSMDDSFISIKFVDIRKHDPVPDTKKVDPALEDSLIDKVEPGPPGMTQPKILSDSSFDDEGLMFGPIRNDLPPNFNLISKKLEGIEPNQIQSDEESIEYNDKRRQSSSWSPNKESAPQKIDYRVDLGELVSALIEEVQEEQRNTEDLRREVKGLNREKKLDDGERASALDRVAETLERYKELTKEGDQYKPSYDKLDQEINDAVQIHGDDPNVHIQGLAKVYPKYVRAMARLKKNNNEMLQQLQKGNLMSPANVKDEERAEDMTKIARQVTTLQRALSEESIEKVEDQQRFISPARRMTRFEIKTMREEEKDKQRDVDIKIDQLKAMLEEFNQSLLGPEDKKKTSRQDTAMSKPPVDGAASARKDEEAARTKKPKQMTMSGSSNTARESRDYDSQQLSTDRRSKGDKRTRGIEPVEEYVEMTAAEANLQRTIEALLGLSKGLLNVLAAIDKHTDELKSGEKKLNPVEKKTESERLQANYEFSRNALMAALEKPEVKATLQVQPEIGEAANNVKESCGHLMDVLTEDKNRGYVKDDTQELYDLLRGFDINEVDAEEVAEIAAEEKQNQNLEDQKKAEEDAKRRLNYKNLEQLKSEITEGLDDLADRVVVSPLEIEKSAASPTKSIIGKEAEKKIDEAKSNLNVSNVPSSNVVADIKDALSDIDQCVPLISPQTNLVESEYTPVEVKEAEQNRKLIEEIGENADMLGDVLLDIAEYKMEQKAQDLKDAAKAKGVDLSKPETRTPEQALNDTSKLTEIDKSVLEKALEELKDAVFECTDCAEDALFNRANGVAESVMVQKRAEPENPFLSRIEAKISQLKDRVDEGDKRAEVPFIVSDINQANERDSKKKKAGDDKDYDKKGKKKLNEKVDNLNRIADRQQRINRLTKNKLVPLIKAVEAILGTKKRSEPQLPKELIKSFHMTPDKTPEAFKRNDDKAPDSSRIDGMGPADDISMPDDAGETEQKDLRRKRKPKTKDFESFRTPEEESKEGFSYKQFTEGSEIQKIPPNAMMKKVKKPTKRVQDDQRSDPNDYQVSDGLQDRSVNEDEDAIRDKYGRGSSEVDTYDPRNRDSNFMSEQAARKVEEPAGHYQSEEAGTINRQPKREYETEDQAKLRIKEMDDEEASMVITPRKDADDSQKAKEPIEAPPIQQPSKVEEPLKQPEQAPVPPLPLPNKELPKELPLVDKKRTYYFQGEKNYYGIDVPQLIPIDHTFKRKEGEITPDSQRSHKDHCDPNIDPIESFYEEADQGRSEVPKLPGKRVFRRKFRKLNPTEASRRREEDLKNKEKLKNPFMAEAQILVKTDEWSRGKPVYIKQKSIVDTAPKKDPQYQEKDINYFNIFDRDPDTDEPRMYQDQGKLRTYFEPEEAQVQTQKPPVGPQYVALQSDDGSFKIIQLQPLEENSLLDAIKAAIAEQANGRRGSAGSKKASKDIKTVERMPSTFRDLAIYQPHSDKPLQADALSLPSPQAQKLKDIASKGVFGQEELMDLMRLMKSAPDRPISMFNQTNDLLDNKPVIERGIKTDEMNPRDADRLRHAVEVLEDNGQINKKAGPSILDLVAEDPEDMFMSEDGAQEDKPSKEVQARELDIDFMNKPVFQVILDPDEKDRDTSTELTTVDGELDPLEELRKAMKNLNNLSDIQGVYNAIVKRIIDKTEDYKEQNKLLDDLFNELDNEVKRRGKDFNDDMFPPNASSMVNNSLKSTQPFKDTPWSQIHHLYENFEPADLFPSQLRGHPLSVVLAALSDNPSRIKKIFNTKEVNKEHLYGIKLHPSGKIDSVLIDDWIPTDEEGCPFVMIPKNHDNGIVHAPIAKPTPPGRVPSKPEHRKRSLPLEVDLWPLLLVKAYAKSLGSFERLLNIGVESALGDITGMPIKKIVKDNFNFLALREAFKRGYIIIAQAGRTWQQEHKKTGAPSFSRPEEGNYFIVDHIVKIKDGEELIAIKNHYSVNPKDPSSHTFNQSLEH